MVNVPPGFRFHKGLDGLLIGFSIVFLVKVEMIFSSLINWWRVPEWTYRPIKAQAAGFADWAGVLADAVANLVQLQGTGGGLMPSGVLAPFVNSIRVVGFPVLLVGGLSGNIFEQLLIVAGFWIGVLIPLRWWVARPLYFWWQNIDARQGGA